MVKFALVKQYAANKNYKVPVTKIHKFNIENHDPRQAYKVEVDDQIIVASITKIADSEDDLDKQLKSMSTNRKRPRGPPERFLNDPLETTDTESEIPIKKRQVSLKDNTDSENLTLRLASLKKNQIERTQQLLTASGAKTTECLLTPISNNLMTIDHDQSSETKIQETATVRGKIDSTENFVIKKQSRTILTDLSNCESLLEREKRMDNRSNILDRMNYRSNELEKQHLQKNFETIKKFKSEVIKLESKVKDLDTQNDNLRSLLSKMEEDCLQLQEKLLHTEMELKDVANLNRWWQTTFKDSCNNMSNIFKKWQESTEKDNCDDPTPVGVVRQNGRDMHIGRGVYIDQTLYTLARSGVNMKNKRKFVRNMVVSIFGYDTLASSTITGRQSNRKGKATEQANPLDSTKVLAVKDIYKHFLTKDLKLSKIEAEIEAEKCNNTICKKISQLKEIYKKPRKEAKEGLGNISREQENTISEDVAESGETSFQQNLNSQHSDSMQLEAESFDSKIENNYEVKRKPVADTVDITVKGNNDNFEFVPCTDDVERVENLLLALENGRVFLHEENTNY